MPYMHLILNVIRLTYGWELVKMPGEHPKLSKLQMMLPEQNDSAQIKYVPLNSALFVSCSRNVQLYGLRQSCFSWHLVSFSFSLICLVYMPVMFFTLEEGKKKKRLLCIKDTLKLHYRYYWPQCSFFTATEHRSRGIICRASRVSAPLLRSQWGELALAVGATGMPVTVSF